MKLLLMFYRIYLMKGGNQNSKCMSDHADVITLMNYKIIVV